MGDKNNPQPTQTKSLREFKKQISHYIWGIIIVAVLLLLMSSCTFSCSGDSDRKEDCDACNGTGYYNAVYCPICDGKGEVDSEVNDNYWDTLNKYGLRA